MSQFRCNHMRPRRVLLKRPAGLSITVDDPDGRSHHPRAFAPSCQQRYEGIIDGPMQFAFANPLRLPGQDIVALFIDAMALTWASYLAAGHVSDTPVTRGPGAVLGRTR
jgi:hypothetical protein